MGACQSTTALNTSFVSGTWESSAPAAAPLTIVTQLSVTRLSQLRAQCRSWNGPLSAAVYLPLLQTELGEADGPTDGGPGQQQRSARRMQSQQASQQASWDELVASAREAISELVMAAGAGQGEGEVPGKAAWCQLDVMLLTEEFDDAHAYNSLYPVNILRNYARLQVSSAIEHTCLYAVFMGTDKWHALHQ